MVADTYVVLVPTAAVPVSAESSTAIFAARATFDWTKCLLAGALRPSVNSFNLVKI